MNEAEKDKKLLVLRWLARIWSLPAILFMAAELLLPKSEEGVKEELITYIVVGTLFLAAFSLLLAWFKEKLGGWISLGSLVVFFILYWITRGEFFPYFWLILLSIGIPAGLFLLHSHLVITTKP